MPSCVELSCLICSFIITVVILFQDRQNHVLCFSYTPFSGITSRLQGAEEWSMDTQESGQIVLLLLSNRFLWFFNVLGGKPHDIQDHPVNVPTQRLRLLDLSVLPKDTLEIILWNS